MRTKRHWLLLILIPVLIYSLQGPALVAVLSSIGCTVVSPVPLSEPVCVNHKCYQDFKLAVDRDYLVLGHIVKSHSIQAMPSHNELLPFAATHTLEQNTWPELFLYSTSGVKDILVRANFSENISYYGFSGIEPRSCSDRRALSAISIPSSLANTAKLLLAAFVFIAVAATFITASTSMQTRGRFLDTREYLIIIAVVFCVSLMLGDHFFDALKPSFKISQGMLWTLSLVGLLLPAYGQLSFSRPINLLVGVALVSFCTVIANIAPLPIVGHTTPFQFAFISFTLISFTALIIRKDFLGFFLFAPVSLDCLRILGLKFPDYPPIYWNIFANGAWVARVAWEQGAGEVLPMAKRAADLVRTNFMYHKFSRSLDLLEQDPSHVGRMDLLEIPLTLLTKAASCQRVGLLLALPNRDPITNICDTAESLFASHDDGKVEGGIFSRVLIYQEYFWFRTIDQLIEEGYTRLKKKEELDSTRHFCAIPLFSGNTLIGVLSLTKFSDTRLSDPQDEEYKEQLKLQIELIIKRLESHFQKQALSELSDAQEVVTTLQKRFDELYATIRDENHYLTEVLRLIHEQSNGIVMLFRRRSSDHAILSFSFGLTDIQAEPWKENPLNVRVDAGNKLGPFIVAFNEQRASYIRRIADVFPSLHPMSRDLFTMMNATTVLTVPVILNDVSYVIAVISKKGKQLSYYWLEILQRLLPNVAVTYLALAKSTSLEAYGRVACRFVSDETTRNRLLELAKKGDLPPTVGRSTETLILLLDLLGSSKITPDPEVKAHLYGRFYNKAGHAAKSLLGLSILQRAGDGIFLGGSISCDGGRLIEQLVEFGSISDAIGQELGCRGTRLSIHYGKYYFGLIGTDNSGDINAVGPGIDHVSKLEQLMKHSYHNDALPRYGVTMSAIQYLERVTGWVNNDSDRYSGTSEYFQKYWLYANGSDFLKRQNCFPSRGES